jgi:amidohydrolase
MSHIDEIKKILDDNIDAMSDRLIAASSEIWLHPEIGHEEFFAYRLLTGMLEADGFIIENNPAGMATAFIATKDTGKHGPTIALISEYDALPKLGHACGHNLFSVSAVGSALALSKIEDQLSGKIVVIGTPAEEGVVRKAGGKAYLVEAGYFDKVDAAMICHAEGRTIIKRNLIASASMDVTFRGKPAHAAGSPHEGINALTAGVLTINNINALRQHFLPRTIVNAILTEGGTSQNTIPDHCVMQISIRAEKRDVHQSVIAQVRRCIEAAAHVTGCNFEIDSDRKIYEDLNLNDELAVLFADALQSQGIDFVESEYANYSWDIGNVSYVCPTIAPYIKIGPNNLIGHTDEFREASNSSGGYEGMLVGAKAMARVAADLMFDADKMENVKRAFKA